MKMENCKRKFPPNPRDSAKGIFSIVFFWWTIPIFRESNNRTLGIEDVVQPRKVDQSELLGHRLERFVAPRSTMENKFRNISACRCYQRERISLYQHSLTWAIAKTFWKEFTAMTILYAFVFIERAAQPQLLGMLLLYFR